MGQFRQYPLTPAEAIAVEEAWSYDPDEADADRPPVQIRILPDGFTDLILRLEKGRTGVTLASASITGPTDQFKLARLLPSAAWVGVRFRFGWVGPILGVSPADLFRQEHPARELGSSMKSLVDPLQRCSSVVEFVASILANVAERASQHVADRSFHRSHVAIALLGNTHEGSKIAQIASQLGVSERTLHRDIRALAGLPPTTLARIQRFQAALARLRKSSTPHLSSLALACGYADQSHFTREVRFFAGLAPTALLVASREGEFQV